MHAYDTLELAYRRLARRAPLLDWLTAFGTPDDVVAVIRNHRPDPTRSDDTLRQLIALTAEHPDALTVALHALAPALRARIGRAITDEYRADALTDLAFVLLDGHALDRPGLAHRLVNRAHNRTYQTALRVVSRGTVNPIQMVPTDPDRLVTRGQMGDFADQVADRVDLQRFRGAVRDAIADGRLSQTAWDAYERHRLARALDLGTRACNGSERVIAGRAERKLRPLIEMCLHAA